MQADITEKARRVNSTEPGLVHQQLLESGKEFVRAEELRIRRQTLRLIADEAKLSGATEEEVNQLLEAAQRCGAEMEEKWEGIRKDIAAQSAVARERLELNGEATRRLNALRRKREHEEDQAYRAERDLCRRCKKGEVQPARPGKKTCVECAATDAANQAKRRKRKRLARV